MPRFLCPFPIVLFRFTIPPGISGCLDHADQGWFKQLFHLDLFQGNKSESLYVTAPNATRLALKSGTPLTSLYSLEKEVWSEPLTSLAMLA